MTSQEQEQEHARFSVLDHNVRAQLNITWSEYVLLDLIYHLSAKYGFCYMPISALATRLGMTERGVRSVLKRLLERELLIKEQRGYLCGSAYVDIAYLKKHDETFESEKSSEKNRKKVPKPEKSSEKPEKSSVHIKKRITIDIQYSNDKSLNSEICDFVKYRAKIKKPLTDKGIKLLLSKLQTLYPNDIPNQVACLQQSILNGWQGVFPLKDEQLRTAQHDRPKVPRNPAVDQFFPRRVA